MNKNVSKARLASPAGSETPPAPSRSRPRSRDRRARNAGNQQRTAVASRSARDQAVPDPAARRRRSRESAATSPSAGPQTRASGHRRDDRVQPESADRDVERRQRAEDTRVRDGASATSSCASRSAACSKRLAGFDDAAGQRHLSAVAASASARTVSTMWRRVGRWKDQQQTRGVADAPGRKPGAIPGAAAARGPPVPPVREAALSAGP